MACDHINKTINIVGLADVFVEPIIFGDPFDGEFRPGADYDHRGFIKTFICTQLLGYDLRFTVRQTEVEEDHIRVVFLCPVNAFFTCRGQNDLIVLIYEDPL